MAGAGILSIACGSSRAYAFRRRGVVGRRPKTGSYENGHHCGAHFFMALPAPMRYWRLPFRADFQTPDFIGQQMQVTLNEAALSIRAPLLWQTGS